MTRRIAFYAPLKSPNHTNPSGDRTIARALVDVLSTIDAVDLVSEFRSRDGVGSSSYQTGLINAAKDEIARLVANGTKWDVWVTYHNYYKAPDLLGPAVCKQLGIPYLIVEASIASKRLVGPWARFARLADAASAAAVTIFYFTKRDLPALEKARNPGQSLVHLRPFLNQDNVQELKRSRSKHTLLSVGMLRDGDKFESYENLAAALGFVKNTEWKLRIIGGGVAQDRVKALFAGFDGRVVFVGQLDSDGVAREMANASVFVWPGVNEAFGMVYLEAQAAGMSVVAEDRIGVREVIGPQGFLAALNDAQSLAAAIDAALVCTWDGTASQEFVHSHHLRNSAVQTFQNTLNALPT
jgi:glycosyltransferase involved in cell wall biosynthesis